MRKALFFTFVIVSLLAIISCQKELSFETGAPSRGGLVIDSTTGDCLPQTVAGTYAAGRALNDSNYIEVEVNVRTIGSYNIFTDTANGYWFKGTGNFSSAGVQRVRLKGGGKPTAEGIDAFFVVYDSTFCNVLVTVAPGTGGGGSGGGTTGGTCNANVQGTYKKDSTLTAANKVSLQHTYAAAGTFNVTTNTVNGYKFEKSVTITAAQAGTLQTIELAGSGKPLVAQTDSFTVNFGNGATCGFKVMVTTGTTTNPPVTGGTYFPLTQNSWWSYDEGMGGTDSIKTQVSGTKSLIGKTYQQFITTDGTFMDTAYYRKDATTNFYYNYVDVSDLATAGITFSQPALDVLFLKETLTTGATWNSDHNGTFSGMQFILRYKFTVVNANASITVNGKIFSNVYEVKMETLFGVMNNFTPSGEPPEVNHYAKGVGLIKWADDIDELAIRHWKVL